MLKLLISLLCWVVILYEVVACEHAAEVVNACGGTCYLYVAVVALGDVVSLHATCAKFYAFYIAIIYLCFKCGNVCCFFHNVV